MREENREEETRDELWTHDLYDGDTPEAGSAVFVRGLPEDITKNELSSNFSDCGRIVALKACPKP